VIAYSPPPRRLSSAIMVTRAIYFFHIISSENLILHGQPKKNLHFGSDIACQMSAVKN
jgi:hypothetical protein